MNYVKFMEESIKKEATTQSLFREAIKKHVPALDALSLVSSKTPRRFTRTVVRLEHRDNRGLLLPKEMRHRGYYMVNSSYMHPGDPNSMRNFGPTRNSVYNFNYEAEPCD